ncbi:MAG TPA: hypothetical protein VNH18_34390, partial [Bryobacteraceae bacterium]|nr:hypothetical protein [Bryobacteraceae bacterium]
MMNSIPFRLTAALALAACVSSAAPPLVKTVNLGPQPPFLSPQQIAMAPAANRIYIFNGPPAASAEIGVVDTTAGLFLAALQPAVGNMTLAGLSDPRHSVSGFAVNTATNRLFAAYTGPASGVLVVIDTTTDSIVQTVSLAGPVMNVALNPSTNKLYVMLGGPSGSAQLAVLDGTSLTQTALISGLEAGPLTVNPANNKIYAALPGPSFAVAVINGSGDIISATVPMPGDTWDLMLNPVTNNVYAKAP